MHIPVLLQEVIKGLEISPGMTIVDATLGGGGIAEAVCKELGSSGTIIGLDQDADAITRVEKRLAEEEVECEVKLFNQNFRHLRKVLEETGITEIDGILYDLGMSSWQLDTSGRGFSFTKDEPLYMTFAANPDGQITAEEVVNEWDVETLTNIFKGYGDEPHAKKIARYIDNARRDMRITTTHELVAIIEEAVPRRGGKHPATRVFQALRIAVNDELTALSEGLTQGFTYLKAGGRMAVISFHSIEDREVKRFFRIKEDENLGTRITKKPITPSEEEIEENPRSRSAKLRIFEKI